MNLHDQLLALRSKEKQITSKFLEVLQKMENSRGYLQLGYSSLFDYLVRGFGYSESSAYQRQSCLKLSRELPEIKEKLEAGKLSYSTLSLIYKSVRNKTTEEKREVLQQIENKSTREVKKLILEPAPPVKIKRQFYKDKVVLRLELTSEQHNKLLKLKALKSHGHNSLESLLESLIDTELKKYENSESRRTKNKNLILNPRQNQDLKYIKTKVVDGKKLDDNSLNSKEQKELQSLISPSEIPNPRYASNPRYVSRRLRNIALKEADYKCQYPGCEADHFLQIDHKIPVRRGGLATRENLQVLCSAHNLMKA